MLDQLAFLTRIRYAFDRKDELIILSKRELEKMREKKENVKEKIKKTIEKRKEKYTIGIQTIERHRDTCLLAEHQETNIERQVRISLIAIHSNFL